MLGILVHGSNHFIVRGPLPSRECARTLVRRWEFVQEIGARRSVEPDLWSISVKEFRENLQWAVCLQSDEPHTDAVMVLLAELEARGVEIHRASGLFARSATGADWPGTKCR
jgi:hypothetical protein